MTKSVRIAVALVSMALALHASAQPFRDRSLSPEERAADLVSRLNLDEKTSLMMYSSAPVEAFGIPAYNWWNEALHGVARNGSATTFPQPIGMAASFDEPLLYEVFTAASDEGRVKFRQAREAGHVGQYQGVTYWTPNINIFRDPRWGRGMETYGEDPYLTGQMGMAVVRGLQGPDDAPVRKAHACAKHYAVHSGPEWNRHQFNAETSERDLRETYLPAFKDLVTKAGVEEVMIAYNRFRGDPCGDSDYLQNTILRGEWGYKGIVLSDCWAIDDTFVPGRHDWAPDAVHAVAAAIRTGTELECGNAYVHIPEAVAQGLLDETVVDEALVKLLAARIRLGELDGIDPWANLPDEIVESPKHKALSRKMARESMVLLLNKDDILPLDPGARIALVGPNGDDAEMQWGNYNPIPESTITLYDALKERIPDLRYIRGCGIVGAEFAPKPSPDNPLSQALGKSEKELEAIAKRYAIGIRDILNYVRRQERMQGSFQPALDVEAVLKELEDIDIVVFAGGISPRFEGEEMPVELPGFKGGDRTDIQLPQVQRDLLNALHEAGKKVVLVNFSGCAMGLAPETESCDAILQAWYPGQEGGAAVAEILFGDECPSGRLPLTFYRSIDDIPDYEDYAMEGRTYRFFRGEPLFSFGSGLSYTSFRYGRARVRGKNLIIPVKNTGRWDADEVVQVYLRRQDDPDGPVRTLRAFRRVQIPAGKKVKVCIPLCDETFLWWSEEAQDMVPMKGKYEILYGGGNEPFRMLKYRYKGPKAQKETVMVVETTMGDIEFKLYNETPRHRDNFIRLAEEHYFDSLLFHRVIDNFVVQGGDPESRFADPGELLGDGEPHWRVRPEFRLEKGIFHRRGTVNAAREGDDTNPDRLSCASQFCFMMGSPMNDEKLERAQNRLDENTGGAVKLTPEMRKVYKKIGGSPHLDGQYTVFGEVIKGMDVLEKIQKVATDENDRPLEDVRMIRVYRKP